MIFRSNFTSLQVGLFVSPSFCLSMDLFHLLEKRCSQGNGRQLNFKTDRKKNIRNEDEKEDRRTEVQNGGRIAGLLTLLSFLRLVYV